MGLIMIKEQPFDLWIYKSKNPLKNGLLNSNILNL